MTGTNTHADDAMAVVAIGMSAGALEVLHELVLELPLDLPAAVVIAQHVASPSILPELVTLWTRLPVHVAATGMRLRAGNIYICPAQHHVVVNPDRTLGLSNRERLRFVRPSIDWLFETVAASFGDRAIAVVLSGCNADGASGAIHVARAGGTVLAQAPGEAKHARMPEAAIATGYAQVVHPGDLARTLSRRLRGLDLEHARARWEHPFVA